MCIDTITRDEIRITLKSADVTESDKMTAYYTLKYTVPGNILI